MADNITRTSDRYTTSDSDYKVKYDGLDPVGGYLGDKIVAGANITIEEGDGVNENKLVISASGGSATDELVKYNADDTTAGYLSDKIIAGDGISVAEGIGADGNKLVITNSALSSYVESVTATPDEQWPISYLKYSKGGVDYDITEIPKPDGLLSGGRVSWVEGLIFDITAAIYYILGSLYTTLSSRVTLSASDPVLNRIDAIIVDVNEVVSVIEGIPAANPQKPSIDPATQIELTYVLIPAGATVPDLDIGEEIVYDENIEWTGSASGVLVNFAYLFLPYHGLTCIDVGTIGNNDTISFTSASLVDRTDFEDFIFNISLKGIMPNQHRLFIRFYNGTTPVSNEVQPAINKKFVIGYQNMSMKLSSFTWMSSSFDTIVFRYSRSSGNTTYVGFSLDYIKLQTSVTTVLPVNTGIELIGDVTGVGTTGSPLLTSLTILNPSPAGTYGGASAIPVVTVDTKGRVTAVSTESISTADEKVKYDASDPTADYLGAKIVGGTGITVQEGTEADENKVEVVNSDTGSGAVASHELNYDHSKIGDYVDEVTATNDEQFPISYLKYSKGGVDYDITEIPKPDGLIQGGAVSWVELLKFDVSAAAYYLEGILYTTDSAQVTLGAADVDNPRIDIIIVDTTGAVSVVAGVPNANPQKPTVDPVTQIELTNILVPTGATEPGIVVTEELIYDENVEWALSYTGTTADGSDATAPYHGSVAVATGGLTNNDTIVFAADEPIDVAVFESLIFNIRLNAVMTNQHRLYVRWMTGVNYTTNEVLVNLNKSVTTGYQNINIPLSSFIWDSGLIDGLQFRWSKSGGNVIHAGIYLDYIKLQKGISVTPVSSGIELTGDVTGTGVTGSPVPTTLATVNANVGTFGSADNIPQVTVDGKGRITAISNVAVSTGDEKVKYDADDTTAGYLKDKVVAGDGISISEGTEADENKVKISISGEATACSYTLDFQASAVVMNDINLEGAITITDIIGLNVASLKLDNVAQALGSGLSIAVSNQQILAWEITRTAPGYAALGIKFTKS